ncbi:hypothetical protein M5K25_015581 [Dendrobium thyrsiflorum]|uniref:Uncharacterized protein n=1 Tax=Dendrobium thyrsiflorum TaxID=117978 RepID=A0ABD0UR71_DENTH
MVGISSARMEDLYPVILVSAFGMMRRFFWAMMIAFGHPLLLPWMGRAGNLGLLAIFFLVVALVLMIGEELGQIEVMRNIASVEMIFNLYEKVLADLGAVWLHGFELTVALFLLVTVRVCWLFRFLLWLGCSAPACLEHLGSCFVPVPGSCLMAARFLSVAVWFLSRFLVSGFAWLFGFGGLYRGLSLGFSPLIWLAGRGAVWVSPIGYGVNFGCINSVSEPRCFAETTVISISRGLVAGEVGRVEAMEAASRFRVAVEGDRRTNR